MMTNAATLLFLASCVSAAITPRQATCSDGTTDTFSDRTCTYHCGQDRAGGDYKAVSATSDADCGSQCAADPICMTAQFVGGNCYMKDTLNAMTSNSGVDTIDCTAATCQAFTSLAQSPTLHGRECSFQCGTDRPGGDYSLLQAGSVAACADACAADPTCVTAQYHESNQFCYLKNQVNQPSSSPSNDPVDTIDCAAVPGVTCTANTSVTFNDRTCTVTCGMDRAGGDYGHSQWTGTQEACLEVCANLSDCLSAQFVPASGWCYPKNAQNQSNQNGAITTIDCPAASS